MNHATDRRRLLLSIWNWLPAFQVVAETEHLPTASARLRVTASSLSRAIASLESRTGSLLFERRGRALVLNAQGRRLLSAMTRATAALAENLPDARDADGPIHVSASGPLAQALVAPALSDLQRKSSSKLVPYVYAYESAAAVELLRSGRLDVVFSSSPIEGHELVTTFLGEASNGIYCGRNHPLFARSEVQADDLITHPFVAMCSAADGAPVERSGPVVERRVDLYVYDAHAMQALCVDGHLLAVLADVVAQPRVREGKLRRLPISTLPSSLLFATSMGIEKARTRLAIAEVRRFLEQAEAGRSVSARVETGGSASTPQPNGDEGWPTMGNDLLRKGEYAAALRAYDATHRSARSASSVSPPDSALHALAIANILSRFGRYGEAEATCQRAMGNSDSAIAAALEATVCLTRCYRGDSVGAAESLGRARAHAVAAWAQRLDEGSRAWARVLRAEGNVLLETDRAREAIAVFEKCAAACESIGDEWERSIALFNLGDACAVAGDTDRATLLLDEADQRKQAIGDRWGQAHVHLVRARIALEREDSASSLRSLDAGLALALPLADPKLTAGLHNLLGRARLHVRQPEEALRAYRLALAEARRCDARTEAIVALLGIGAVHLRHGHLTRAQHHAARAHALARAGGSRGELARTLSVLGQVAAARGQIGEGMSLFREAYEEATHRRARPTEEGFVPRENTGAGFPEPKRARRGHRPS